MSELESIAWHEKRVNLSPKFIARVYNRDVLDLYMLYRGDYPIIVGFESSLSSQWIGMCSA